jgi:hypothetical protein
MLGPWPPSNSGRSRISVPNRFIARLRPGASSAQVANSLPEARRPLHRALPRAQAGEMIASPQRGAAASKEPQPSPTEACQRAGVHAGESSRAASTRSGLSRSAAAGDRVNARTETAGEREVSTDREIADYLEVGLISRLLFATIALLMWLKTRGAAPPQWI